MLGDEVMSDLSLDNKLILKDSKDLERDVWIWGTGNTAEMLQEGIKRWDRFEQIKGYVDSDPEKWGSTFYGKPIKSPTEIMHCKNACILICTNQLNFLGEIKEMLDSNGAAHWYVLEQFVLCDLKDKVLESLELFEDSKSKELYKYLIECKFNGEYPSSESGLLDLEHGYFFLPDLVKCDKNEVFVDVGCYTGDTVKEYLEIRKDEFKHIHSFEPDTVSYETAKKNIADYCMQYKVNPEKVSLYPYGVGETNSSGVFERTDDNKGSGSKFTTGKNTDDKDSTKIIALDDFLNGEVSFIKADVESYEWQVIRGAEHIIKQQKPKLAICIYHNVFDFIQIPGLIKKLSADYKLYVRQQAASWSETILYAVAHK
ncbi:FkbM family methyltransferase [Butyrivibrio sp. CB08]|nr:FkbM family methyltransferase [Butyrivibrio sp. CB08]